jgi:hypothetical protein
MDIKVSIAPLAQILCRLAEAVIDPFERWQMRMEDRVFIRERRENERRDVELAAVQANWDRAQKHSDDALDVFRQNRDLYERQAMALEAMQGSVEYIAKALAVMNERSVRNDPPSFGPPRDQAPTVVRKPMRKART